MIVAYALASWIAASLLVGGLMAVFFHGASVGERPRRVRPKHNG